MRMLKVILSFLLFWNVIFGVWNLYIGTTDGGIVFILVGLFGLVAAGLTNDLLKR